MANEINFGYVTPDKCPFEIMTPEQMAAQYVPHCPPPAPLEPPPPGMNRVYQNDEWVLVPNPVAGIVA